jgi:hypothetical protein
VAAQVLERGEVDFLYRPRVGEEHPETLAQVQRFHAVLKPWDQPRYRRLLIGRKRLPDASERERFWAYVDRVAGRLEAIHRDLGEEDYETRTRGVRHQPGARAAGGGAYAIVSHDRHAHLAYALAPAELDDMQQALRIDPRANYIVAVRNPDAPSLWGLYRRARPAYPAHLRERFRRRRYAPLEPAFLDHEGTELILIGAGGAPEEDLGIELWAERAGALWQ